MVLNKEISNKTSKLLMQINAIKLEPKIILLGQVEFFPLSIVIIEWLFLFQK